MRRHFVVLAVATLVASVAAQPGTDAERFWPQWRGPHATGASRTANPPTEWSETRNVRWKVEIPGRGSGSPVVWGDRLFLLSAVPMGAQGTATHEPRGHIQPRGTPLVVEHAGRAQVVTTAQNRIRSYDLETGTVVWESEGLTMNPIPSPVASDGMVFAMSGFQGSRLRAIRLADAKGDITGGNAIVWTMDRDTPYVPSPLLYDGLLYVLKSNSGILSVFDAMTGRPHYQLQRLAGIPEVYSSPVAARGRRAAMGYERAAAPQVAARTPASCGRMFGDTAHSALSEIARRGLMRDLSWYIGDVSELSRIHGSIAAVVIFLF